MPIKYVDDKSGEFLKGALKGTGAPSNYGITTPEQLVQTSLSQNNNHDLAKNDIFFAKAKL